MNYYEQFYDDLEFCDPEEEPQYHHGNQGYYQGDDFDEEEDWTHRGQNYHQRGRGRGGFHGYRGMREGYDRGGGYYEDRGHQDYWNRGSNLRGRVKWYGNSDRGRDSRGGGNRDGRQGNWPHSDRGRGSRETNARGQNRGRGRGMGFVSFVKATEDTENTAESADTPINQTETGGTGLGYNASQNPTSLVGQESSSSFVSPVLTSYGYGEGSGFEYFGGSSNAITLVAQVTQPEPPGKEEASLSLKPPDKGSNSVGQHSNSVVKKSMVSPTFNFVKASSEFRSTDVAFHETETCSDEAKVKNSFVNPQGGGSKRAGFGMCSGAGSVGRAQGVTNMTGSNMDLRFQQLQEAVSVRNLPGKNGIEVLHMAVDKVKMKILDEIKCSGRTQAGAPMFECKLEVDGVVLANGESTAKKRAKHDAYSNAVKLLSDKQRLTVQESANGALILVPMEASVSKESNTPGLMQGPPMMQAVGQMPKAAANSLDFTETFFSGPKDHVGPVQPSYTKPKIVFHASSSAQQSEAGFPAPPTNPQALAMKLLNFVKEGASSNEIAENSRPCYDQATSDKTKVFENQQRGRGVKRHAEENLRHNFVRKRPVKTKMRDLNDLAEFIIIDNSMINPAATELSILHHSANVNKVVLKLEYDPPDLDQVTCRLILSDNIVSEVSCETKEDARMRASAEALEYLRKMCYTIKIKQDVDSEGEAMSKDSLVGEANKDGNVISDDNIGNMLLRKMGWTGGGCGKDGKGIAEPVKTKTVIGREGLGLSEKRGIGKNFQHKVRAMLQDYIKSEDQGDLHFSSELQKEERAIIHNIGQALGLKTQSKGKNENRYLIVSRKRSAFELLQHVMNEGGETSKYEIVPPSDDDAVNLCKQENMFYGHCKQ